MQSYKWDYLKLKACRSLSSEFNGYNQGIYGLLQQVEQQRTGQTVTGWRKNALGMRDLAWSMIESWDIRLAGKLIEIFPHIVPAKYQDKTPICDYDERGNWAVMFD